VFDKDGNGFISAAEVRGIRAASPLTRYAADAHMPLLPSHASCAT
jgi:hypothetical protein